MTEVFYQPRRSGKTTTLIKMAHELNQKIIVSDRCQADLIAEQADDMGVIIHHPIGAMDYITDMNTGLYRNPSPIIIDEAQNVLRKLFKTDITAMTITDYNDYEVVEGVEDEVELLKQMLTLKDKEIARLNKTIDRLDREDVNE